MLIGSINLGYKMLPAKLSYVIVSTAGILLSVVINTTFYLNYYRFVQTVLCCKRCVAIQVWAKNGPQVARMLQASLGKGSKQL